MLSTLKLFIAQVVECDKKKLETLTFNPLISKYRLISSHGHQFIIITLLFFSNNFFSQDEAHVSLSNGKLLGILEVQNKI